MYHISSMDFEVSGFTWAGPSGDPALHTSNEPPYSITASEVAVQNKANLKEVPSLKFQVSSRGGPSIKPSDFTLRTSHSSETALRRQQGLSCETKPNLGGMGPLGKSERRVRGGSTTEWSVRNKANLRKKTRPRRPRHGHMAGCAKQSQLPNRREEIPILHGGLVGIPGPDHVDAWLFVGTIWKGRLPRCAAMTSDERCLAEGAFCRSYLLRPGWAGRGGQRLRARRMMMARTEMAVTEARTRTARR